MWIYTILSCHKYFNDCIILHKKENINTCIQIILISLYNLFEYISVDLESRWLLGLHEIDGIMLCKILIILILNNILKLLIQYIIEFVIKFYGFDIYTQWYIFNIFLGKRVSK